MHTLVHHRDPPPPDPLYQPITDTAACVLVPTGAYLRDRHHWFEVEYDMPPPGRHIHRLASLLQDLYRRQTPPTWTPGLHKRAAAEAADEEEQEREQEK